MDKVEQTERSEIVSLHHVGHIVRNIDDGISLYRRLGFLPTSPNFYVLESEGQANQAIGPINAYSSLRANFIEIVSIAGPQGSTGDGEPQVINVPPEQREIFAARLSEAGDKITSWFSQFEGVHILALLTEDIDETARRLTDLGVGNSGASTVGRKLNTKDGPKVVPTRFLEVGAPGEDTTSTIPEGRIAIAENPDVEVLHQQTNTAHPNGAADLVEAFLYAESAQFEAVARRYEGYLGCAPRRTESGCEFELAEGRVTLLTEQGLETVFKGERPAASPAFVGYAVAVADLASTKALLEGNGFPVRGTGAGELLVPSSAALGVAILFRSAN